MTNDEISLEERMAAGEILDIGEVVIEEEEEKAVDVENELEIPVYFEEQLNANEDTIDRSMLPEVIDFVPGRKRLTPLPYTDKDNKPALDWSKLPDLVIYRGPLQKAPIRQSYDMAGLYSASSVKISDAQKRLEKLAELMFGVEKAVEKAAKMLGRTTERGRFKAFGEYFAGFLNNNQEKNSTGYISPEQFIIQAENALKNLQAGEDRGRPIRKSIRDVLSGQDESVYKGIRQKLPEIARAVATTGFAVELNNIYSEAGKNGGKPVEYAREIKNHRLIDRIAENLLREGLK